MLGIVIGVALFGFAFYKMVTAEADAAAAEDVALAQATARAATFAPVATRDGINGALLQAIGPVYNAPTWAPPGLIAPSRAVACFLEEGDYVKTDLWTSQSVGAALPLANRLVLMLSVKPYGTWPAYARRIFCALKEN